MLGGTPFGAYRPGAVLGCCLVDVLFGRAVRGACVTCVSLSVNVVSEPAVGLKYQTREQKGCHKNLSRVYLGCVDPIHCTRAYAETSSYAECLRRLFSGATLKFGQRKNMPTLSTQEFLEQPTQTAYAIVFPTRIACVAPAHKESSPRTLREYIAGNNSA